MSIDPKKGGQCWSCKFCEDIATQTDNPSGSYYRKCNKSGHEYIDTCRFYCGDYVWDGKTTQYHKTPSSSSSSYSSSSKSTYSTASSSSTSKPSTSSYSSGSSSGTKKVRWLPWVLLVLLLLGYGYYYVTHYAVPSSSKDSNSTATLATEPNYPVAYVNISDTLNLRIGPGQTYDIITAMPNGAKVYVQETKGGWSYVIYQDQKGWCSAQYLVSEKQN